LPDGGAAVQFSVPVPPSVNKAYRNTSLTEREAAKRRRGKHLGPRVKTDSYKTWQNAAGWRIAQQNVPPVAGNVAVHVACPLAKNRDCDNVLKLLLDLLVYMHVLRDDSQIDDLHIVRQTGEGEAVVTIWTIS
jgi:Holliday junction resolvase RusA-like endonuclease